MTGELEEDDEIVLFEKVKGTKTCAGGVEGGTPDQKAFAVFLAGLLHFRKDDSAYSLDPKEYPAKPLFVVSEQNVTINDLFWLIFDDMPNWQNLGCLHSSSTDERMKIVNMLFDGVEVSASGPGFSSYPLISKYFVAYIDALIVETPFFYAGSEARISGLADGQFQRMTDMYGVFQMGRFLEYSSRKAAAWYGRFPIVSEGESSSRAAADGSEAGAAEGDGGPAMERNAKPPAVRMSLD